MQSFPFSPPVYSPRSRGLQVAIALVAGVLVFASRIFRAPRPNKASVGRAEAGIGAAASLLMLAVALPLHAHAPAGSPPYYSAERAARVRGLTQPYGWLSLVALHWLQPGVTTVGSAAGNTVVLPGAPAHLLSFELKDGQVTLVSADPSVTAQGRAPAPGLVVGSHEDDASALTAGRLRLWVIDRSGRRYLRVKDADAPTLKHFRGLNWYAPDARYRVKARWVPDATPHTMQIPNKIGQISTVTVPGHVEFELNGTVHTLVPLEASAKSLWFVFRDETFRETTDQGGRFLTTAGPSGGLDKPGEIILDFNEAVNPPCAYSPYATCPLASRENRLTVAIPAGEKRYDE
jgi:uncharacterized protein (DUF1684 family)